MVLPKNIYGWDGFELISGDLSVGITPTIGGRIMSVKYQGHELLFVDPQHTAETFDPRRWKDLSEAKKSLGFKIWGGDKTWVAPQKDWLLGIPPLDLDAAPYTLTWNSDEAVMTSPICRETGLQIIRRVSLHDGQVRLIEELYNRTSKPLSKGLWNVTQVKRPCYFEIPSNEGKFRSYHHEDKTLPAFEGDLSVNKGQVRIDCSSLSLFKVGGIPSSGEIVIFVDSEGQKICWKKIFMYDPKAQYAHASVVEVFNSSSHPYAEIELHAPLKELAPGECTRLEQIWKITLRTGIPTDKKSLSQNTLPGLVFHYIYALLI